MKKKKMQIDYPYRQLAVSSFRVSIEY